jgi:hypothetical protein
MATVSLAEVRGTSIKELYETEDEDYVLTVATVTDVVVETREQIAREVKRRSGR